MSAFPELAAGPGSGPRITPVPALHVARGPQGRWPAVLELHDGDSLAFGVDATRVAAGAASARDLAGDEPGLGPTLLVTEGATIRILTPDRKGHAPAVRWRGARIGFETPAEIEHRCQATSLAPPASAMNTLSLHFARPGVYPYRLEGTVIDPRRPTVTGAVIVAAEDAEYWSPVDRAFALTLHDLPFVALAPSAGAEEPAPRSVPSAVAANGRTDGVLPVRRGEVVRLFLVNATDARPVTFRIPGARMKLVGSDGGRVEREAFVQDVPIGSSESAVVHVLFDRAGTFPLEHRIPGRSYPLGTAVVEDVAVPGSHVAAFEALRHNPEFEQVRAHFLADLERDPDMTLTLARAGNGGAALRRRVASGARIKVRLIAPPDPRRPLRHHVYVPGQRLLVLSRDGAPIGNLAWSDMVALRSGETADVSLHLVGTGTRTAEHRIAERSEVRDLLRFDVTPRDEGDEGRVR